MSIISNLNANAPVNMITPNMKPDIVETLLRGPNILYYFVVAVSIHVITCDGLTLRRMIIRKGTVPYVIYRIR